MLNNDALHRKLKSQICLDDSHNHIKKLIFNFYYGIGNMNVQNKVQKGRCVVAQMKLVYNQFVYSPSVIRSQCNSHVIHNCCALDVNTIFYGGELN